MNFRRPSLARAVLSVGAIACSAAAAITSWAQGSPSPTPFAATQPVSLDWRGAGCGTTNEVLAEVARLLGGSASGTKAVDVRVSMEAKSATKLRITVRTRIDGREGERSMDVGSCNEAVQTSALVIALAVDPSRVAARTQVASSDGGTVVPVPVSDAALSSDAATASPFDAARTDDVGLLDAAAAAAVGSPAPMEAGPEGEPSPIPEARDGERSDRDREGWLLGVTGIVDVGTLPKAGFGLSLNGGYTSGAFRAELALRGVLPRDANVSNGRTGRFSALGIDGRGCAMWRAGVIALGPCALLGGDRIAAVARNVATPVDDSAVFFSAGGGLLFTAALTPWLRLRASADGLLPFARPAFVVALPTSNQEVHQVSAGAFRGAAGLELRL